MKKSIFLKFFYPIAFDASALYQTMLQVFSVPTGFAELVDKFLRSFELRFVDQSFDAEKVLFQGVL